MAEFKTYPLEEITEDMPGSRALRRRAHKYIDTAHSRVQGRSGLTYEQRIETLETISKALELAKADIDAALEAVKSEPKPEPKIYAVPDADEDDDDDDDEDYDF